MENVKIYDIKQSAQDNYIILRSLEGKAFYWADAKFLRNEINDYIFVVNSKGGEALFTRLSEKGLLADYDEAADLSSFSDRDTALTVSGKWDRFVRLEILDSRPLPQGWKWTTNFVHSETYDLWKANGDLVGQVNRIDKINDLRRISWGGSAFKVLEQTQDLLNGIAKLVPEIVLTIQTPKIQGLIADRDFVFQKAQEKLKELLEFLPIVNDNFYERLIDGVSQKKDMSFLDFLDTFPKTSNEYLVLRLIGELIAYCDAKAAGKTVFNQYDDKRTIAHSFVRQTIWVLNLLKYKERKGDLGAISSSSIQNAIGYLLNPDEGLTLLSEDQREMVARYLLQTAYDKLSFIQDTLRFFAPYSIRPVNSANLTRIISDILYTPEVKKLWFEQIQGLVVADNTGWLDDAVETMKTHKKIALWWNKQPSGGLATQARLREQIDEHGFFYIYYTRHGAAYCRSRIIDFSLSKDYPEKNWNAGEDVEWYNDKFDGYSDDDSGKKARIVFLANEVIQLERSIPYDQFTFYQGYQAPTQNNMQPYAEVEDETPSFRNEEVDEEVPVDFPLSPVTDKIGADHVHRQILMAAKTKPFVLLAGISGIGKSRLVRTLAYKTCAIAELQQGNTPGNFQLIQVKPNWSDSTDLLGYRSGINDHYKITPFMKFLLQAWRYPQIPFFLCMDEMNLAPVELYMAEYLSAIESRRSGNETWTTDALIAADVFAHFKADEFWQQLGIPRERKIQEELTKYGLRIPPNLVIVGTVNMDETTHSFSRKVLDRAMTIEMNEVDLRQGLNTDNLDLAYPAEFYSKDLVCGAHIAAWQVQFDEREQVLSTLIAVNKVLETTPFKFAYRVRDESLVYCFYHSRLKLNDNDDWFTVALDEIICMKVLSRIEGDETKCRDPLVGLEKVFNGAGLIKCSAKVREMLGRLKYGYTTFFP